MNILLLTTHLNSGGITSYLKDLARGLLKLGHSVFIGSSGGQMKEQFENLGVYHLDLNIRTKSEADPRIYLALPRLSDFILANDIDVIHSQTRITQVMGALLNRKTGRPYVATCHGFFKSGRFSRKIFPCWGQAVIAISPAVARHLEDDFQVEEDRVILIENGIETEDFPLITPQVRRERKKEFGLDGRFVIGIIARLSDVKGHRYLIDAMPRILEKNQDVCLAIVGGGREEQRLKNQVRNLGIEHAVRFLNYTNRTQEFLAMFDVVVMPSLQEGLGLSVLEAQAMGLPVIASRVGGLVSLIEDGRTGFLIEPRDSGQITEKVMALLDDPDLRAGVGVTAREQVREKFHVDIMVSKTAEVYRQLVEAGNG